MQVLPTHTRSPLCSTMAFGWNWAIILVMMGLNRNSYESSSIPSFSGTFTAKYLHTAKAPGESDWPDNVHVHMPGTADMLQVHHQARYFDPHTSEPYGIHVMPSMAMAHSLARADAQVCHIPCPREEVVAMLVEGYSHDTVCSEKTLERIPTACMIAIV